jgi:hypothetical protein
LIAEPCWIHLRIPTHLIEHTSSVRVDAVATLCRAEINLLEGHHGRDAELISIRLQINLQFGIRRREGIDFSVD